MPLHYPEILLVCEDDKLADGFVQYLRILRPEAVIHCVNPNQPHEWDMVARNTMERPRVAMVGIKSRESHKALDLRNRPYSSSMPWLLLLHPDLDRDQLNYDNLPYAKVRLDWNGHGREAQVNVLLDFLKLCEYP